jgi:hypothetical protein
MESDEDRTSQNAAENNCECFVTIDRFSPHHCSSPYRFGGLETKTAAGRDGVTSRRSLRQNFTFLD